MRVALALVPLSLSRRCTMHRETGLIPFVCSLEGGQIVLSGGCFAFCFWLALAFCPCLCVLDEGDVANLIECGNMKCWKSLSPLNATSYPVGVCTRQAVSLLQDVTHPSCRPLQNGIPEHLKEGSHPPPPSESNPQLQRADRLGPPIEQQASSSSQTAGVTLPHPKHGETCSVSSMGTSGPGRLPPSDSFSSSDLIRGLQPIYSECSDRVYTMCFLLTP